MPWTLVPERADEPFVALRLEGMCTPADLQAAGVAAAAEAQRRGTTRGLADATEARGGVTLFHLLALAEQLSEAPPAIRGRVRAAVVAPREWPGEDPARFWETACVNRGVTVRTFHDRDTAAVWLRSLDLD